MGCVITTHNMISNNIDDFIVITEVDRGSPFVTDLFLRKYKTSPPIFPHHVIAFWKRTDGLLFPVSYVHFTFCGDIYLAGGACTDGESLRAMSVEQSKAIEEYGGLMLATLRYGFERWGSQCEAIFTCCGDQRALKTTPKLGFTKTDVEYLLVAWMRDLTPNRREELTAKAKSFMPF